MISLVGLDSTPPFINLSQLFPQAHLHLDHRGIIRAHVVQPKKINMNTHRRGGKKLSLHSCEVVKVILNKHKRTLRGATLIKTLTLISIVLSVVSSGFARISKVLTPDGMMILIIIASVSPPQVGISAYGPGLSGDDGTGSKAYPRKLFHW